jgi:hypothetical protein
MQLKSVIKSIDRHSGKPTCLYCWLCMPQEQWSGVTKLMQPSAHESSVLTQLQRMQYQGVVTEIQWEVKSTIRQVRGCGCMAARQSDRHHG